MLENVLNEFIHYQDQAYRYNFESSFVNETISISHYTLYSQQWPINETLTIPSTTWQHNLTIYVPGTLAHNKALLCVSGGYNTDKEGKENWSTPKELFNFAQIAITNMAPVINLQNVPNQFLLINNTAKKEDQIIAYTYKLFIEDPIDNIYLPAHLPMAKSIIKAMDASEEILQEEYSIEIDNFILSGISKRGWASWLAAIEDERVSAIIPVGIDILNVQETIPHICNVYKNGCPDALKDYIAEGIVEEIGSQGFTDLMRIEDPLSYLGNEYDPKYKTQFAKLGKYIINSSGDDFFTPDCSKFYFEALPGEQNYIRYLPNSLHYLQGNFISDSTGNLQKVEEAISNFYYFSINNVSLPEVDYEFTDNILTFNSSIAPESAVLWSYNNEVERDFRFLSSYSKWHFFKKKFVSFFSSELCDRCYNQYSLNFDNTSDQHDMQIIAELPPFTHGWQATFLEAHYNIDGREFIITTEVEVTAADSPFDVNSEL